jgi:hypothetical protein
MIWCPVFMKICAGAWLNCVVFIERMMAISSACFCKWGSSSEISAPDWPYSLKSKGDPSSRGVPFTKANRSPSGMKPFGISWPSYWRNSGLLSNRSTCDGAPAMNR